ncbi:MAG: hypothetical protein OXG23_06285 [Chloroflexi bacterium]|nr:hypothetical protein [Chloroflexota bacterium]
MMGRRVARIIIAQVRFTGLLLHYCYLRLRYIQLHIEYYLLKAAGATLVEAVKIEYWIKSMSKEDRVIFATCVAVSIYILALIMLIRM